MTGALYHNVSFETSRLITKTYSTSFSIATSMFDKEIREAIYGIYGFVRMADEIVDAFHGYDKRYLLEKFENDYHHAINYGFSISPVLNAFQYIVKKYSISKEHVRTFLNSMKADLNKKTYNNEGEIAEYIYGSADAVGLICLKVFCNENKELYKQIEMPAMKLGSAFQKVNFLRDLKYDVEKLDRQYFPELSRNKLDDNIKLRLIKDIENDFNQVYQDIKIIPGRSKLAVLIAYYYTGLLKKIQHTPTNLIINSRIRISNSKKVLLLIRALIHYKLKLV